MYSWIVSGYGLVPRKIKPGLGVSNSQSSSPHHLDRREGLETELIIDHAYVMKPP